MITVEVNEDSIRELYKNSREEVRTALKAIFDWKILVPIQERIKSYEDACDALGYSTKTPAMSNDPSFLAYYKLSVIAKALNEGWVPQIGKDSQWFPVFSSFDDGTFEFEICKSTIHFDVSPAALALKDRDLCSYFGSNFRDLWQAYLFEV